MEDFLIGGRIGVFQLRWNGIAYMCLLENFIQRKSLSTPNFMYSSLLQIKGEEKHCSRAIGKSLEKAVQYRAWPYDQPYSGDCCHPCTLRHIG